MTAVLNVYGSDDYAGMVGELFAFYFGYEATLCPTHGKDSQCECDKEWCFTASHRGEEIVRFGQSELDRLSGAPCPDDPFACLLVGIGGYLDGGYAI